MAKRKRPAVRGTVIPWPGHVQREGVEEVGVEKQVKEVEEVEEVKEVEEPARNVRKVDSLGRDMTKREAIWTARFNAAKQWKQTSGRFAKSNTKDKIESSLNLWLRRCMPGGLNYTKERWERLNVAFGEGWEKECCPYLGTGVRFERDEAAWEAILEEVLEFMRINGRFPKGWSGDMNEVRLYNWLRYNADTTSIGWTRERHDKLIDALGMNWEKECFPRRVTKANV